MLHYSQNLVVPSGLEAFCRQRSVFTKLKCHSGEGTRHFPQTLKISNFQMALTAEPLYVTAVWVLGIL